MPQPDIRIFPVVLYYDKAKGKVAKRPEVDKWSDPANTVSLSELPAGENYGVLCGGPSNLVVIDFDRGSSAKSVVGITRDTLVVQTQSGGIHVYYTCIDADKIKSGTGLAPNVDVRANGGFVVGPGSSCMTPDGLKTYEILRGGWDSIAPIPAALFGFLRQRSFIIKPADKFKVAAADQMKGNTELNLDDVQSALDCINIPANSYSEWFKVCAALQTEQLFSQFLSWSSRQAGFVSSEDCRKQWDKVGAKRVSNGYTIGTIFFMAKQAGWQRPIGDKKKAEHSSENVRPSKLEEKTLTKFDGETK